MAGHIAFHCSPDPTIRHFLCSFCLVSAIVCPCNLMVIDIVFIYLSFSLLKFVVGHWPSTICATLLKYGLHHREKKSCTLPGWLSADWQGSLLPLLTIRNDTSKLQVFFFTPPSTGYPSLSSHSSLPSFHLSPFLPLPLLVPTPLYPSSIFLPFHPLHFLVPIPLYPPSIFPDYSLLRRPPHSSHTSLRTSINLTN